VLMLLRISLCLFISILDDIINEYSIQYIVCRIGIREEEKRIVNEMNCYELNL